MINLSHDKILESYKYLIFQGGWPCAFVSFFRVTPNGDLLSRHVRKNRAHSCGPTPAHWHASIGAHLVIEFCMWHVSYIYYWTNSFGEKYLCWRGPTHMWLEPPCPCKGWQDKKTNLIWFKVITNVTIRYFGFALATLFQDLLCRLIFVLWYGRV